ncbi:MAG: GNAT family N-acetyltransferase [Bacteroidetes bacterium]|nr:GNAT family N-acetyltransferase [Bacteroidota bacterium]
MQNLSIITNRLIIRNLVITDLDNFHQYRSNPEVTKYQGFDVMTKEACTDFIHSQADKEFGKPGQWIQYAIENKETNQLIGDCAIKLDQYDVRLAEVGMTISDLHQKNGYAKEALTCVLDWLFETQNIHRVTEIVDAENLASINLLKSLNFKQEGHFIENIFFKGKWGSEFQYAMLKREWKK